MSLQPDTILLDKYEIVELLGSGAWGDVYLARDVILNRPVAIKHLKADLASDKTALERFIREARIIADLKHPNVVTIHALEQAGEDYYIVMEYAEQGTLANLLGERGRLPREQVIEIALCLCQGLEVVHRKGVIHRDIKASNILLFADEQDRLFPKLSDFGVARIPPTEEHAPLTIRGEIVGTFCCMAPEQARGDEVDARSDIFALGILLYQMLAGELPDLGTFADLVGGCPKQPDPPSQSGGDSSEVLDRVVLRALSGDRDKRFQTARDMARALRRAESSRVEKPVNLGRLYAQAMEHFEDERWSEAIRVLEEITTMEPGYKDSVSKLKEARQCEEGAKHFQAWQKALDEFLEIVSSGAYCDDTLAEWLEETCEQVNVKVLYAQGEGYFERKIWNRAAEKFGKVLDLDKNYLDAAAKRDEARRQESLGRLYEQGIGQLERKDWGGAVERFEEIARLEPTYRDVEIRLKEARGLNYFHKGKWAEAVREFKEVLQLASNRTDVNDKLNAAREQQRLKSWYDRALKLEELGKWEEAYQLFRQILTTVPGYEDVPERLARAGRLVRLAQLRNEADELWIAGRRREAVDRLSEAVEFDRRYGELDRHTRGDLKSRLRAARKDLKQQEDAYSRGMKLLEVQDYHRAAGEFRRVLELSPNHQDAVTRLREAEEGSREAQEANDISRPQLTDRLFDWKRVARRASVLVVLTVIIAVLIRVFLIPLKPIQLARLGLGILMVLIALSIGYDIFRAPVNRVD